MHCSWKILNIALVAALVSITSAASARAQGGAVDPQCRAGTATERATQDACQKAVDVFQFMTPQLGASIIGGNVVLGEARSLGGFGHFSMGVRGNVLRGRLPRAGEVTPALTGAASTSYEVDDQPLGLPTADVAIGVLPGFDVGGLTLLGLDGLMSVAYVPEVTSGDLTVRLPEGSLRLGFGARVSIVEESGATPSISISFLQRDLPSLDLAASPGNDHLGVSGFALTTDAWRAVVGKSFGPFSLVIGGGQDHYDASATVDVTVKQAGEVFELPGFLIGQALDRQTIFADLSINLPLVKLVAEVGQVSGGSLATYNTFGSSRADDALQFASLGLRLRW